MEHSTWQAICATLGAVFIIGIIFAVGFMNEPKTPPPQVKVKKPRAPRKPKLADPKTLKE